MRYLVERLFGETGAGARRHGFRLKQPIDSRIPFFKTDSSATDAAAATALVAATSAAECKWRVAGVAFVVFGRIVNSGLCASDDITCLNSGTLAEICPTTSYFREIVIQIEYDNCYPGQPAAAPAASAFATAAAAAPAPAAAIAAVSGTTSAAGAVAAAPADAEHCCLRNCSPPAAAGRSILWLYYLLYWNSSRSSRDSFEAVASATGAAFAAPS